MDLNDYLKIGESSDCDYVVQEKDTADRFGNIGVQVLSTPAMLNYIELTSSKVLWTRLPQGFSLVGIGVNLTHEAAVPVGGLFSVRSTVSQVGHSKVTYEFTVTNKGRLVSKGSYKQAIVNLHQFLEQSLKN